MPSLQAFYRVIHRIPAAEAFRGWSIVGDLSAGPRQAAFDWASYAETYLVVAEPTSKSMLTARRVAGIAESRGAEVRVVASQVQHASDERLIARTVGRPVLGAVPLDDEVRTAERLGVAPIDHAPGSRAVVALERLADLLP